MCSPNTKACSAPATPFVWAFTLGTLYTLRDRGELEQVGRGIYRLSTAPPLTSRFESESGLDEIVAQVRRFRAGPDTARAGQNPATACSPPAG